MRTPTSSGREASLSTRVRREGWATWSDNPRHRRARLLTPTPTGVAAVEACRDAQHAWADAVGAEFDLAELDRLRSLVGRVVAASRRAREAAGVQPGSDLGIP